MPKSLQRCVTSLSVSSKVPSSSRNSMRSRADILPSLCWRSRRFSPPPSSASRLRFFSSASFSSRFMCGRIIAGTWGRQVRGRSRGGRNPEHTGRHIRNVISLASTRKSPKGRFGFRSPTGTIRRPSPAACRPGRFVAPLPCTPPDTIHRSRRCLRPASGPGGR